ncbi:hypothetical protein NFJ02_07g130560 [Pycnococcus provasolii]
MGACCSSTADPVLKQTLNHVDFTPAFTQGNAASALAQVHQAGGKVVVQRDHKNKSSVVKKQKFPTCGAQSPLGKVSSLL